MSAATAELAETVVLKRYEAEERHGSTGRGSLISIELTETGPLCFGKCLCNPGKNLRGSVRFGMSTNI